MTGAYEGTYDLSDDAQVSEASGLSEAAGTRIIWPSDIREEKRRVDAKMDAVLGDVNAQSGKCVPAATAQAFFAFHKSWRAFYCNADAGDCTEPDASIWGLGGQMDEIEVFEGQLYQWQQKIAALCGASTLSTPLGAPPTPTDSKPSDVTSWARYAVWGLAIVAGLYVAKETQILRRLRK